MELSFANGVQEYTVHGVKGDVVIRFNPTDGAFIQRLYNAFDTLDKKQEKYADEVQKCGDRVEIFNIAATRRCARSLTVFLKSRCVTASLAA